MQALPWKIKLLSLFVLGFTSFDPAFAGGPDLVTDFEKSGGKASPAYPEVMEYLKRLDAASPWVRVETFGRSPEGRDEPVVIVDSHGRFTPCLLYTSPSPRDR